MRDELEPVERPGKHARHDESSKTYDHPAFGQIGAYRVQGKTTLYGSDFLHQNFVIVRIHRSQLNRELSRDWHFATDELVEVALSEAQWATFVSSMNQGSGVPCTIQWVRGEGHMPSIPLRVEEDVTREEFSRKARQTAAHVAAAIEEIEGEIGASLSKAKREKILARLTRLRRDLDDSMPFIARSFDEHMETTVEKAKVEVNAYVQAAVMRAGLTALTGGASDVPLQLGTGTPSPEKDQLP